MLKKTGIVVAISAACALSISPLAFAGEYKSDNDHGGDDNDHKSHHKTYKEDCAQDNGVDNNVDNGEDNTNFLAIQGNTLQISPQLCGNQTASGIGIAALIAKAKGVADNG